MGARRIVVPVRPSARWIRLGHGSPASNFDLELRVGINPGAGDVIGSAKAPAPKAVADGTLGLGANAWKGEAFTSPEDCGYVFGGYALPLHDPVANRLVDGTTCSLPWRSELGYHVNTASTHTVKVGGTWRMYIPEPRVLADDSTHAGLQYAWPRYLPDDIPKGAPVQRYPSEDWSALSSRFSPNYISFVDSPDRGRTFPVFAPFVPPLTADADGCVTERNVDHPIWNSAGWTPTAIPSRNDASDVPVDGVYAVYRDPSIIDVRDSHGVYLMIVVECRSTSPTVGDEVCHPCIHPPGNTTCAYVYNRIVVFTSTSPDFPSVGSAGGTWPDPKDWTRAVVLLDGGGDPLLGSVPDENYGVPSATLSPDGTSLLLYTSVSNPDASNDTWESKRIRDRYDIGIIHINTGLSCFAIDVSDLTMSLDNAQYWEGLGGYVVADGIRVAISSAVEAGYQGEVMLSDGQLDNGGQKVAQLQNLDAQFTVVAGQLWAHFGATDSAECPDVDPDATVDCTAAVHQIRRARAVLVAPDSTAPGRFSTLAVKLLSDALIFPEPQVPFALFLESARCFKILDMAALTGITDAGLARDPDVAELDHGTVRISFAGGASMSDAERLPSGLLFAIRTPPLDTTTIATPPLDPSV